MQFQLSLRVADELHETLLVRGEPIDAVEAVRLLIASNNAPAPLCHKILATLVGNDRRFCWDGTEQGPLSLQRWEGPDPDLAEVAFVALDLETTGARAGLGKITEVGAVRIEGFQQVRRFGTLVNPMRPIPPMITQITGISQEMVADAPRIEEVLPELMEFLENAVVVAHNAPFDVGFLNYELQRLSGRRLGEGAVDTLPLARALAPGLPNYKLQTVAEALGAPVSAYHRALADAEAAAHVFLTLAGRLQERGITRLGEMRAYLDPSSRMILDKLRLTRELPRTPGTYRFLDKEGHILYVGKAERLRERVRSHFVINADGSRKVRQAIRMLDRIDWDETHTSLEAVVREQQLILEHRPSYNLHGTRPETYAYVKASGSGPGLNLSASCKAPRWLCDPASARRPAFGRPLIMGPFRGRTRVGAALDLLQRCYPIRHCPRSPEARPCVRSDHGRCLAPCRGDAEVKEQHDSLVTNILGWLAGEDTGLPDPFERAEDLVRALSRQRRFEEAGKVREAREHLENVRRSYESLAEASTLRFAAVWPETDGGTGTCARLNLVWNGVLQRPLTLHPDTLAGQIEAALSELSEQEDGGRTSSFVAVPQKDLDTLLAVRRWFHESERTPKIMLPTGATDAGHRRALTEQIAAETYKVLAAEPAPSSGSPALI